jgi:HSP20 family protein
MSRMLVNRFGMPGTMPREMDRLFQSLLGGENDPLGAAGLQRRGVVYPGVNVWEDASNIYVEAELPGFSMDQVDVTMLGTDLTISGERPEAQAPQGAVFHRRERAAGRFSRSIHLGVPIDADKVNAALASGVLMITLPKAEAAKPRKIEVKPRK